MTEVIGYLRRLGNAGIKFHSLTEEQLCTDNEMVRDVMLALASSMAKMERNKISERTKAGLARVMAAGVKVGRRPLNDARREEIAVLAGRRIDGLRDRQTARHQYQDGAKIRGQIAATRRP